MFSPASLHAYDGNFSSRSDACKNGLAMANDYFWHLILKFFLIYMHREHTFETPIGSPQRLKLLFFIHIHFISVNLRSNPMANKNQTSSLIVKVATPEAF
jgi:hypothetical protein